MSPSDVFSPDDFMNMTVEGVGSTTITPIPTGIHLALIGSDDASVKVEARDRTDGRAGRMYMLNVTFDLIDDQGLIRAAIDGRDPKHVETFFLDMLPDGKTLDMGKGKNVRLNRLREALNQNTGTAWSPAMLRGAGPVALQMKLQPDKREKDIMRNHVTAFGRPGQLKG